MARRARVVPIAARKGTHALGEPTGGAGTLAVDVDRSEARVRADVRGWYALVRELEDAEVEILWCGRLAAGECCAFPVPLRRSRRLLAVRLTGGVRSWPALLAEVLRGAPHAAWEPRRGGQ